jgi:hypothetical protein
MSERTIIQRILRVAVAVLLAGVVLLPVAQAKDIPIYVEYTGTGHYGFMPDPNPFVPPPPNVVSGDAKGSFGAMSTVIISNFVPQPPPAPVPRCESADHFYFLIGYANAVTSFKDGSQIFARGEISDQGWMCINPLTGEFFGESYGEFVGGAGRFEGAGGPYTSPFRGRNLYFPFVGVEPFPYGPEFPLISIKGSILGTVTFD